ncbi:hypothetical protein [Vibrio parahaemolyticus]|uniref:hypothetical protein n=1 Tax=Vibrio parahaemolyticus TaxID=670 RepID=UPI000789BE0B|nr:hypothetical protein [Vibrio parahaemolyticus]KYO58419.1 hypothetical protein AU461_23160 [Vibrio parahaemolyticus]KYX47742.1 hypothetical protein AU389_02060 [Vibrio parahaemolyticus]TPB41763.1 hypothetical protein DXJ78_24005 [Vibrio parahaemolyticus]
MDAKQLTTLVVRPTLKQLGLYSRAAEQLIVGTIYQESLKGEFIKQVGGGPALGVIQMEPATYHDIWDHYLAYKRSLANKITELASMSSLDEDMRPNVDQLITNLAFAVGMCRVHYLRKKPALPSAGNVEGLAHYWKDHYNTHLGAGTVEEFIEKFPREILDI